MNGFERLQDALEYINDWMPFELDADEFLEVLFNVDDNDRFLDEIASYSADTAERERFMDLWARQTLCLSWPTFGDSVGKHENFEAALHLERLRREG